MLECHHKQRHHVLWLESPLEYHTVSVCHDCGRELHGYKTREPSLLRIMGDEWRYYWFNKRFHISNYTDGSHSVEYLEKR